MQRAKITYARVRGLGGRGAFFAYAAVITVAAAVEALHYGHRAVGIPAAVLFMAGVWLAWWDPLRAIALQFLVVAAQAPFGDPIFKITAPVYAIPVVVGLIGGRLDRRRFLVGVALAVALCATVVLPRTDQTGADLVFICVFLVGLPSLVGRMFYSRRTLNTELAERARRLEADRRERESEAAAVERRRIAGELHDLVAHGVSGMVVQASAARRLVAAGDARAPEAILAVEEGGREALTELRRLLGVLRRDDEGLALAPQPSLSRLGVLVAQLRASGREVRLQVSGEHTAVSPGVDVAGYRLVEETLRSSEATPVPADVTVRYGTNVVELEIEGPPAPDSVTIAGLRQRVKLFGGELWIGRRGGPTLRARLPHGGMRP